MRPLIPFLFFACTTQNNGDAGTDAAVDGAVVDTGTDVALDALDERDGGDAGSLVPPCGKPIRVSVATGGIEANGPSSGPVAVSADGRFVAFTSIATNLTPNDLNGTRDVFVHDLLLDTTECISVANGMTGNGESGDVSAGEPIAMTPDGRYIAFISTANNLVAADTNMAEDIFVRDRVTQTTERISLATNGAQLPPGASARAPHISDDGRFVVFASSAQNLAPNDQNNDVDVFIRDRKLHTTTLVSRAVVVDAGTATGNKGSFTPVIGGSGQFVAFASFATDIVPDSGAYSNVFLFDVSQATNQRVSIPSSNGSSGDSTWPILFNDSSSIIYGTDATNLAADSGMPPNFLRWNRLPKTTVLLDDLHARAVVGPYMQVSRDGSTLAFFTTAQLDPRDSNVGRDVYTYVFSSRMMQLVSLGLNGSASGGVPGDGNDLAITSGGDGAVVVSAADNIVTPDNNGAIDVFLMRTKCP